MKIHIHNYGHWSNPVFTYTGNLQQWRTCTVCNKADFRTLPWHKQTALAAVIEAITQARGMLHG